MATLVLSAAGAALGGSLGGSVLGLTGAVIGKAVGATIGSVIDQKLLGGGSQTVESGRLDTLRLQSGSEGATIPRVFGQMRVGGQVIWSSRFRERRKKSRVGGKGNRTNVVSYSYSVSFALALCEGEITRIGRVWADGNEISLDGLTYRLYTGRTDQVADPLIEAIEGSGSVSAYRGTAYIVFENFELASYGNRVPQMNFEVVRKVEDPSGVVPESPFAQLKGVAMVPGTGEYALGTTPVRYVEGKGVSRSANSVNTSGQTDMEASLAQLRTDMPQVDSVALVVSWFGDNLSCVDCAIEPKVEQSYVDGSPMPWTVSGLTRGTASNVSRVDGKSLFGGTPTDQSVVEAIVRMRADGLKPMFYPFILMDVIDGNTEIDPWTGNTGQPAVPWRGRITLNLAPGHAGSVDHTQAAGLQVDAFFGQAAAGDFAIEGKTVSYSGPNEWSYRRFILHYAHLCKAAGGVDAFLIGSEFPGLTRIRDASGAFPAVAQLVDLAQDVRSILGAGTKISYAADWSEYFGYQPQDGSGDVFYNLDPLWAAPAIDFVGIDNYMPLSDWRDTKSQADAGAGSIYSLDYLTGNVEGGEGYDWYYASQADRDVQFRTPIIDAAHGEHWIYRYKDISSWWSNAHHERIGGQRSSTPTSWVPQSKPVWFTELGCSAVDKGTNQPNVFLDDKSSEGQLPYYSTGGRDDFIQFRYYQAHFEYWSKPENNPVSAVYGQPMIDLDRAHAWAWDARPWPDFPNRLATWSDGVNYGRGHWISGRVAQASLADVVSEIAARSGFQDINVRDLHGIVRGYLVGDLESARQSLQPLMLSHGFECAEIDGQIKFTNRVGLQGTSVVPETLVSREGAAPVSVTRSPAAEQASRINLKYYDTDRDYQTRVSSAAVETESEAKVTDMQLPVALTLADGDNAVTRFLAESNVAQDQIEFALPRSFLSITAGDVVTLEVAGQATSFRIDRIDETVERVCHASRIEYGVYQRGRFEEGTPSPPSVTLPAPLYVEVLDLPMLGATQNPDVPVFAVSGLPWLGDAAVYSAVGGAEPELCATVDDASIVGTTLDVFYKRAPWLWSTGDRLRVAIPNGEVFSQTRQSVLNGANIAAIRAQGATEWEIIQFSTAKLVSAGVYELSDFLRGQYGTEAIIPAAYPSGADFVLLDGSAVQPDHITLPDGLVHQYWIGPASRAVDDSSYLSVVPEFQGLAHRPYAPVHLRAQARTNGDTAVQWTRQTRLNGDDWTSAEVALGETSEAYLLRVRSSGSVVREETLTTPEFVYSAAQKANDTAVEPLTIEVAQISSKFGPGPFQRIVFNG